MKQRHDNAILLFLLRFIADTYYKAMIHGFLSVVYTRMQVKDDDDVWQWCDIISRMEDNESDACYVGGEPVQIL